MSLQEVTRAEFRRLIRGREAEYSTASTPAGWYVCKEAISLPPSSSTE